MRILAFTSSHPPDHRGGYELRYKAILDHLVKLGHDVCIITTKPIKNGSAFESKESCVYRKLHLEEPRMHLVKKVLLDYQDISFIHRMVTSYKPDLVYLGHIISMTKTLFPYLASTKLPIVFDEGGKGISWSKYHHGPWFYLIEHKSDSPFKTKVKQVFVDVLHRLSRGNLKKQWSWPSHLRGYYNSYLNRQNASREGGLIQDSVVIHSGVDIDIFTYRAREQLELPVRLICLGRIEEVKGQIDAIRLLDELMSNNIAARLDLMGATASKAYLDRLKNEATRRGVADQVRVLPMAAYEKIPGVYKEADVCFFPSYQRAGFSRIPLEAMASGVLIISYGNEGSSELIHHQETGFIVPEGNTGQAAKLIQSLIMQPGDFRAITARARVSIEQHYSMDRYLKKIEIFLLESCPGK